MPILLRSSAGVTLGTVRRSEAAANVPIGCAVVVLPVVFATTTKESQ